MRYITIALAKGRLAKKAMEIFEQIGIPCEEMKDEKTRKLIFTNEELGFRFFLSKPSISARILTFMFMKSLLILQYKCPPYVIHFCQIRHSNPDELIVQKTIIHCHQKYLLFCLL